jgi:hypothetical protein
MTIGIFKLLSRLVNDYSTDKKYYVLTIDYPIKKYESNLKITLSYWTKFVWSVLPLRIKTVILPNYKMSIYFEEIKSMIEFVKEYNEKFVGYELNGSLFLKKINWKD